MSGERSYIERNDRSRAALADLVAALSDDDLARAIGDDWSVAVALAHMAFWDHFTIALLEEWERDGYKPLVLSSAPINAAALAGWRAIPPLRAAEEALAAAGAADAAAAAVSDELAARVLIDRPRVLDRSVHRAEHVEQIRRALGD